MKIHVLSLLFLFILIGCQASGGGGGDVINHVPAAAKFTLSTTLNKTYVDTNTIDFSVTFPFEVTVTGSPELNLTIGSSSEVATYVSGDGTKTLLFRYTVAAGDNDNDGISVNNSINLNGGTLMYNTTENCPLVMTVPSLASVKVDTTAPTLTSVSAPLPNTYYAGQTLAFLASFSETVFVLGTPRIAIDVGGTAKYATYTSGSGTSSLVFTYTVTTSDVDADGIGSASPVDLNSGVIKDFGGNNSSLFFTVPNTTAVLVAGANPIVSTVTPPANGTYSAPQNLDFTLTFNKVVNITGSPRLVLTVGSTTRYASYLSGSGTSAIKFRYTVIGGDNDPDGIALTSTISLNGGTIQDTSFNNAVLTIIPPLLTGVKILSTAPAILSISLPSSPPANGYDVGQNIDFTVNFSEAMTEIGGNTRLRLDIGGVTKYATYLSGSGSANLVYRYTVLLNDEDLNGLAIISPFQLNGSTLQNAGGVSPTLTFTPPVTSSLKVDAKAPLLSSNTIPTNGSYTTGQNLDFDVTYHEPVTVTGTPRLSLDIGGSTKYANYLIGSGTTVLRFRYTVQASDNDADGIALNSTIDLNSGSIQDPRLHNAELTLVTTATSGILVDTSAPTISSVTPPANGSYISGQNLDFTVNWNEAVTVTGTPRLAVVIGSTTRYATYTSGSGSNTLLFRYTIASGDDDSDGIVVNSPLELNAGTIRDAATNNGVLTFTSPNTSAVLVSGAAPSIASITLPANGKYTTGQNVDFSVVFTDVVLVTPPPRIALTLGSGTVYANYVSGGGTNTLLFRYTVAANDYDVNGLDMVSPLQLNGGAIQNVSMTQNATLTYTLPDTSGILIDGIDPVIASVTPPADKTYIAGENMDFIVNYSHNVSVTGTPSLTMTVGASVVNANYVSGSGTNALTFRYTVAVNDVDVDGVALSSNISLNAGTIKDLFTDNASLAFTGGSFPNKKVDGVVPTILSVTGPTAATYNDGQNLDFTVNFSENVTVTGTPRIQLTVGASTVYANYLSGTGTASAVFRYVVQTGDLDSDGIASVSPLQLNAGTLKDAAGNDVSPLTFTLPDTSAVNVDANAALITSITPPSNATYKTTQNVDFVVNYSKAVDVTGTPRIAITAGAATVYANYQSGTGTSNLTFRYTVAAGVSDSDGIALTSPLQLNGGTIKDSSSVNAGLTFTPPTTTGILVDGIDITISSVTPPADATYKIGDNLDFTVTFNYPATVTGTPRISLTVGSSTLYANYTSGSGTVTHTYRYTVASPDLDTDGITTISNIGLNGGTIKDAFNDNATLTFTGTNYPNKKVDGVRPTISSAGSVTAKTYISGENIDFTLNFSENVTITGSPRIVLTVGATTRYATYLSGTGTSAIVFRHAVTIGDLDANGIAVANGNMLDLNSGTVVDAAGNAMTNFLFTPPTLTSVNVDAVVPTISSISGPAGATYGTGGSLNFTVNFSESVTVTGTPTLTIDVGGTSKSATYISGSGTSALVFRYTVITNDSDTNGVGTVSPLLLSGGTLKDIVGNNAVLTFTNNTFATVLVDALQPYVTSVTVPAAGVYKSPTALSFILNFNENVTVTSGTPRLHLTIGSTLAYATYASGSGTTALTFNYTVNSAHLDLDGIAVANSNNIDLNGATIRDANSNSANLEIGTTSTANVYVAFTGMQNWYDLSDSTKITTAGSNVTGLTDKIGTANLSHSGAGFVYNSTGFNGGTGAYATCTTGSHFNPSVNINVKSAILVFRTPSTTANQFLLYSTGGGPSTRARIEFSTGNSALIGQNGGFAVSGTFGSGSTSLANFYTTSSPTSMARAVQWDTAQSKTWEVCDMNGQLAEVIFLSTNPNSGQLSQISDYLFSKYGLSFP